MTRQDSRSVILARRARFIAAALAGSGVSVATHAHAEDPEAPPPPAETQAPRICLSDVLIEGTEKDSRPPAQIAKEPAPEPCLSVVAPENRLYLRVSGGPALLGMSVDEGVFDESGSGFGPSLDLAVGIMLSDSLALAFGVTGFYAPSLGNERLGSGTFWRAGTVLDYFPDPALGLHAALSFGPVYFGMERAGRDGAHGIGFGAGVFLGYDLALSRYTALGFGVGGTAGFGGELDEKSTGMNARAAALWIGFRTK